MNALRTVVEVQGRSLINNVQSIINHKLFFDICSRKIYHARLMYARPFIDSLDFAGNGGKIDTQVPVAGLPRLQDVLDNNLGILYYHLYGSMDNQGRPVLDVSIDGTCQLRCQRCLNTLDYVIRHDARLLLCDESTLEASEDEEEFDGILADAHLDVLALLEDEILLNLPISPMHESGACQVREAEDKQEEMQHPFAVLKKLKRK